MLYQPPEFKSHPLPSVLMMQCVPPQDCSSPPRTTKEKHLSPNPSFNLRGCLCSEPANHLHLFFHPSSSLVRSETHLAMPSITQQTWGRILVDRNRWIAIFFLLFFLRCAESTCHRRNLFAVAQWTKVFRGGSFGSYT